MKPTPKPKTEAKLIDEIKFWENAIRRTEDYPRIEYFPASMRERLLAQYMQHLENARAARAKFLLNKMK